MQIAICLLAIALILILFALKRLADRVDDAIDMVAGLAAVISETKASLGDTQGYVSELETDIKQQISDLSERYEEAGALINAAREAAEEELLAAKAAQETERRLQDGINSILNYSSQKYGDDK